MCKAFIAALVEPLELVAHGCVLGISFGFGSGRRHRGRPVNRDLTHDATLQDGCSRISLAGRPTLAASGAAQVQTLEQEPEFGRFHFQHAVLAHWQANRAALESLGQQAEEIPSRIA